MVVLHYVHFVLKPFRSSSATQIGFDCEFGRRDLSNITVTTAPEFTLTDKRR